VVSRFTAVDAKEYAVLHVSEGPAKLTPRSVPLHPKKPDGGMKVLFKP